FIQAERVRRQVVEICEAALAAEAAAPAALPDPAQRAAAEQLRNERRYWIQATLAEAWLGIGDTARSDQVLAEARTLPAPKWLFEPTGGRVAALRSLLVDSPLRFVVGPSSPTGAGARVPGPGASAQ